MRQVRDWNEGRDADHFLAREMELTESRTRREESEHSRSDALLELGGSGLEERLGGGSLGQRTEEEGKRVKGRGGRGRVRRAHV